MAKWVLLLRLAILALPLFAASAQAAKDWRQTGNSMAAKEGGQCVRETSWMRRNHMDLIKHGRDVTVHQGVRTIDGSLAQCIACHVNRADDGGYLPVNSEQQFCEGCHQYTGTTMDCFTCHATMPVE